VDVDELWACAVLLEVLDGQWWLMVSSRGGSQRHEKCFSEAPAGDSGLWSAATEEEWVVVLRVGSMEEEGGRAMVLAGESRW
jgi:hypothetical protein